MSEDAEPPGDGPVVARTLQSVRPRWDEANRQFFINGVVVKTYKHKAVNQTAVLAALQESGWARRVLLPFHKVKTSQTLKELNRLAPDKMRFRGDGTGEGLTWELVDLDSPERASG